MDRGITMKKLSVKQLLIALKKRGYTEQAIESMCEEVTKKNPRLDAKTIKRAEVSLRMYGRCVLSVSRRSGKVMVADPSTLKTFFGDTKKCGLSGIGKTLSSEKAKAMNDARWGKVKRALDISGSLSPAYTNGQEA